MVRWKAGDGVSKIDTRMTTPTKPVFTENCAIRLVHCMLPMKPVMRRPVADAAPRVVKMKEAWSGDTPALIAFCSE
jgi:hypothetical protein